MPPVREALDIGDPVVRPAGAGEDARVSLRPMESGIGAPRVRGPGACENRKDQQRENREALCEDVPNGGPAILFHGRAAKLSRLVDPQRAREHELDQEGAAGDRWPLCVNGAPTWPRRPLVELERQHIVQ